MFVYEFIIRTKGKVIMDQCWRKRVFEFFFYKLVAPILQVGTDEFGPRRGVFFFERSETDYFDIS